MAIVIAALIQREPGSIIYKHRRIGQDGHAFECLKFRTMVPNADQVLRELLECDPAMKAEWVWDHKLRSSRGSGDSCGGPAWMSCLNFGT